MVTCLEHDGMGVKNMMLSSQSLCQNFLLRAAAGRRITVSELGALHQNVYSNPHNY